MNDNEKKSKIEELNKYINSRGFSSNLDQNRTKTPKERVDDIRVDWEGRGSDDLIGAKVNFQKMSKKRKFTGIFLTGSFVFFVVAMAVAVFVIFGENNIISSDNVSIALSGPVSVSGGEILSLEVIVTNKNTTSLELADLIVEYPDGARSSNDFSKELPRERFSLGQVKPGDKVNQPISVVLFGEKSDIQKIKFTVEYRVSGSNAIFSKDKFYDIEINDSPVSMSIMSLSEVNSGKEISLDITMRSNSDSVIKDLMLVAEYPFGFSFKSSVPNSSYDQNVWRMGDISPGEERKIKITGTLEGQDDEERFFRFFAGIQSKESNTELETAFVVTSRSIFIKKPFLSLDVVIDGSSSENQSIDLLKLVNVGINWTNNLSTNIANVEIRAVISGDFAEDTVFVEKGFYNSIDNTVTWGQERNAIFESVSPGERGQVGFRVASPNPTKVSLSNPEMTIDVSVRGRRLSESGVSEEINSSVKKTIRFNTSLSLNSKVLHHSGSIANTGSIPPVAEKETTYTIVWALSNSVNDVSNTIVTAKLPSYVQFTNNVVGTGLTYNSVSREVSWDAGYVPAGSGIGSSPREISFQISLLPSISQIGIAPILVGDTRVKAKDDFTGTIIDFVRGALDTRMSNEPSYRAGDDVVIK